MKSESIYRVKLFTRMGYRRKTCPQCGRHYWALDPDSRVCGDQPCVPYSFLGKPPTPRSFTMSDIRELFLSFFEAKGHSRVKKYPVVARWRNDVYLVGASIYNFQPWVTEGVVAPPANPLVISQPCIRLTDVDLVGKSGRHLTSFEMMAHHAFNREGEMIYWTDETVELCHEFFTSRLGIKPESINYIEDMWIGGGNAGEDLEVVVDGIEVATLVFMHYRTVGERLEPLKNLTVDTGYGLERIVWLTKGAPTVYDAVFEPAVRRLRALAGYRVSDDRLFLQASRLAGQIELKSERAVAQLRQRLAREVGATVEELEKTLRPLEAIYAIADYTRTLVYMLGDGVVPSNVEAGYLARLLIRKTLRNLAELQLNLPLPEVLDIQLEEVSKDYPEYGERRELILRMADVEEKRYLATLKRGKEVIAKLASEALSRGRPLLTRDDLIQLYDSHGITPEFAQQTAQSLNVKVEIPDDFYSGIAKLHERASQARPQDEDWAAKLAEAVSGYPPTRTIYYEDPYATRFKAKVLGVVGGRYLILDGTAFYAEGGGQPPDHGVIRSPRGEAKVVDVRMVGRAVVHAIEGRAPEVGDEVEGVVDWERRYSLMKHHTSTHILLSSAVKVLGPHVWQSGAQKDVDRSRLDIAHYERLTPQQVQQIELLANQAIMANLPVEVQWLSRDAAESKYGFRLYQGGVVPGREVRVVKVGGWDVEACGGTHCRSSGEIGFLKIIKTERIQDGVERIHFVSGERAVEHIQREVERLRLLAERLGCPVEALEEQVERLMSENKSLRKEAEALKLKMARFEAAELLAQAPTVEGFRLLRYLSEGPVDFLIKLASEAVKTDPAAVAVFLTKGEGEVRIVAMAGEEAVRRGVNAGQLANLIARRLGGGGGGRPNFGQGGSQRLEGLEEVYARIEEVFRRHLASVAPH